MKFVFILIQSFGRGQIPRIAFEGTLEAAKGTSKQYRLTVPAPKDRSSTNIDELQICLCR